MLELVSLLTAFLGSAHLFQHAPECSPPQSTLSLHQSTNKEEAEQALRASHKKTSTGLSRSTNLYRSGSIKDLITRFSGPERISSTSSLQGLSFGTERVLKSASVEALESPTSQSSRSTPGRVGQEEVSVPSITVTPPYRESNHNRAESLQRGTSSQITARIDCPAGGSAEQTDSAPNSKTQTPDSVADSGMGSVSKPVREDGTTAWHRGLFNHISCMIKAQCSIRMMT